MKSTTTLLAISLLAISSGAALASDIEVSSPWVRGTVAGQKATGAFMKLTAKDGARLVGASSPAAGVTEVHEMKMEGDVMKMRAVPALELPAGKPVELKPGGYHVMLLDLKAPLAKDTVVPITLVFKDSKGAESRLELKVPVSATAPAQAGAAAMMDGHKH